MQLSYKDKSHNKVDYFVLPNGCVDVFLHRNENIITDDEGNLQHVAEEVYFQTDISTTKEQIELDFENWWSSKENNISESKNNFIKKSKTLLGEFLGNNPLLYNGEYYSVTQEKQALLTSTIATYQLEISAGIDAVLKWNTTGDICREFTIEEIVGLVVAIKSYVQPRVEKQQEIEIQIKNANTPEELNKILIDYEEI